MDNQLKIFSSPEFGQVRTLIKDGQPYFVGKEIAEILGYAKPLNSIAMHVDEGDSLKQGLTDTLGRMQETILINESGLYSLILGSKLPTAKKFKHWVTSEVLPQIRQTGGYIPASEDETDEDIMAKALLIAQRKIELKDKAIANKEKQLAEQKPKVQFAEHVASANNSMLVREVAKIISKQGIEIGEQRLYKKLRDWGWVFKNSCEATQEAIKRGYMEVAEVVKETSKGSFTFKTSRVTGKGQLKIFEKLKAEEVA